MDWGAKKNTQNAWVSPSIRIHSEYHRLLRESLQLRKKMQNVVFQLDATFCGSMISTEGSKLFGFALERTWTDSPLQCAHLDRGGDTECMDEEARLRKQVFITKKTMQFASLLPCSVLLLTAKLPFPSPLCIGMRWISFSNSSEVIESLCLPWLLIDICQLPGPAQKKHV